MRTYLFVVLCINKLFNLIQCMYGWMYVIDVLDYCYNNGSMDGCKVKNRMLFLVYDNIFSRLMNM